MVNFLDEDIDYSKELILVLDDDDILRETVGEMLQSIGFRADCAKNAKEACDKLETGDYTFLLTDIKMPDINGIDFLKKVRQNLPDLCAIAMTGYPEDFAYVEVIKAGASDFINKPFSIEELEAKIRRAMIERNRILEFKNLSITDSLTGLFNRRHFYSKLKEEFTRAKRQKNKHRFAVIMLDLDGFKAYNDKFGHLSGDSLLEGIGKIIKKNIRHGVDTGYRYGGDEFTILLIDATPELTSQISKRIRDAVKATLGIDVSIGAALYSDEINTPEELVTKADQNMYKDKRSKQHQDNV